MAFFYPCCATSVATASGDNKSCPLIFLDSLQPLPQEQHILHWNIWWNKEIRGAVPERTTPLFSLLQSEKKKGSFFSPRHFLQSVLHRPDAGVVQCLKIHGLGWRVCKLRRWLQPNSLYCLEFIWGEKVINSCHLCNSPHTRMIFPFHSQTEFLSYDTGSVRPHSFAPELGVAGFRRGSN